MGIFFGGSGYGAESSCQILAHYKLFRVKAISTGLLVWICSYKIEDEKAHTFSRRSKNVQKADKNRQKTDTV